MSLHANMLPGFSDAVRFSDVCWDTIPNKPGVYIIYERSEILYIGMAGRDGSGSLRRRLKDHSSGQVVNMFAQYLFLARVQFVNAERITHPRAAKLACREYILNRCSFRYMALQNAVDARALECDLKYRLKPTLNATEEE